MFFKLLDERKVGTLVAALKNILKISDGLVCVKEKGEVKF
jgi:hypothetical protein